MMAKGFLSFALVAIFVFALVSSVSLLRSAQPDYSYEGYRAFFVQELAIKRTFYAAVSDAASQALSAASSSGQEPRAAVRISAHLRAIDVERQLRGLGYDVIFWCGSPSESARLGSSEQMRLQHRALLPEGAIPISLCAGQLDSGIAERRLHFSGMGFSYYSYSLGMGKAVLLPDDYEVQF